MTKHGYCHTYPKLLSSAVTFVIRTADNPPKMSFYRFLPAHHIHNQPVIPEDMSNWQPKAQILIHPDKSQH